MIFFGWYVFVFVDVRTSQVHACHGSTWEVKTGGPKVQIKVVPRYIVPGQPGKTKPNKAKGNTDFWSGLKCESCHTNVVLLLGKPDPVDQE